MGTLGTLHVQDNLKSSSHDTFNVQVAVKKADFELISLIERTVLIFLIFELFATAVVIYLAANWYCVLFCIPMLFRWLAFPSTSSFTYSIPSFVLIHSIVIVFEAIITVICCFFAYQTVNWKDESLWMTVSLAALSAVLFVRFGLSIVQQSQYNRVWMGNILSERRFFFTIV